MAITFLQKRKKEQYLILVLILIILGIFIVLWQGFLAKPGLAPLLEIERPKKVEINFEVLENPLLKALQPFEEIPPFEEEIGRENPFIPY